MNKQRPLTANEEESYLALDQLLKKSPKLLDTPLSKELKETIQTIEAKGLSVIIRKNARFPYYSDNLVEKSLSVHIPNYEMNNIMPTGTLDNAGRLYHYVKSDFHYLDGSNGSFIVLKRESSLFEFFTRWIIWMILLIILVAIAAAWLINKRLTKTTIEPLEALEKATKTLGKDAQKENPFTPTSHQTVSTEVKQLQLSFEQMWQDLEEANAEREKYEANRKELIANISHDLKTPITSIIGYVEGLMDGVANTEEKKQRYLTVIHEKSLGLNDLIEELFLYSKLDLDRAVFTMEKTNFTRFIAHILEEYRLEQEL
ncbi:MAG: histidine kinase dimerization/phospho-acceptor domain-containing protein, partial [Enterococcus faecalis]|nr:histidine kinase dimerization/phospho-acceptor domain-containing protein [Enterococcus faecalis]